MTADRDRARELLAAYRTSELNDEGRDTWLEERIAEALAESRSAERSYIVEQIRANATELQLYAGGRSLDLLAWILELPGGEARSASAAVVEAWIPPASAKDGRLYAVVYTDEPIVDYDYLIFANGEWWHPARGNTCDAPGLILELPPLPPPPEEPSNG